MSAMHPTLGDTWRNGTAEEMKIVFIFDDGDVLLSDGRGYRVRSPSVLQARWTFVMSSPPVIEGEAMILRGDRRGVSRVEEKPPLEEKIDALIKALGFEVRELRVGQTCPNCREAPQVPERVHLCRAGSTKR